VTWVAWRQFRLQAIVAAVVAAAIAVILLATRAHVDGLRDGEDLTGVYKQLRLLGTVLIGVPAFIGAFWGAPLLARELESGTVRLAWTQSVTPRRWLATKLTLMALVAAAFTALFTMLFTSWSSPLDAFGNRIGTANFGQRGVAPVAYALYALALGAFLGALIRRTVPAIAATLVGFGVVRYIFQLAVRPHLVSTVDVSGPTSLYAPVEPGVATSRGWRMSTHTVDARGHTISAHEADRLLAQACDIGRQSTGTSLNRCADRLGIHDVVRMIPGERFWTLQLWEAACFLTVACILVGATFWLVSRRRAS
jgi:ABC-type transport system involved in multi-copper enzyme maturation permease subunit